MASFPEPTEPINSRSEVLLRYLDYFRERVLELVWSLPPSDRRRTILPSDWSPLQLVRHLTFVELRWLDWGFAGRDVAEPWGDEVDGRWSLPDDEPDDVIFDAFRARAERSRTIATSAQIDQRGAPGPRWAGAQPATLERVLLHLVQEYARHLGQLDVVVEFMTGAAGGE